MSEIGIGILGCGNVGAELIRLLHDNADQIQARAGRRLVVRRVAVRTLSTPRDVPLPPGCFTSDPAEVVDAADVDVVVEVMGGIEPARDLIIRALEAHKPVVTANKELVSSHGVELAKAAARGGDLLFEASVCGGIPVIRTLRESLAGDRVRRVMGIVNGTTNYILTRMTESDSSFESALDEAKRLGYAERDASFDVEGKDAAGKAAIIASIAFGVPVDPDKVFRQGITEISSHDIAAAAHLGYVIKLVVVVEEKGEDIAVRVHPTMVPLGHPLASVREAFNAVLLQGDAVGELMLYGRGAGGGPTASAVLGDLIDAATRIGQEPSKTQHDLPQTAKRSLMPPDELRCQFYLSMRVADRPGVLAKIADVFAEHGVSIRLVEQYGAGADARLVFVTHTARQGDVMSTWEGVRELAVVHEMGSVLHVISTED